MEYRLDVGFLASLRSGGRLMTIHSGHEAKSSAFSRVAFAIDSVVGRLAPRLTRKSNAAPGGKFRNFITPACDRREADASVTSCAMSLFLARLPPAMDQTPAAGPLFPASRFFFKGCCSLRARKSHDFLNGGRFGHERRFEIRFAIAAMAAAVTQDHRPSLITPHSAGRSARACPGRRTAGRRCARSPRRLRARSARR
jgi:hypothetical protein